MELELLDRQSASQTTWLLLAFALAETGNAQSFDFERTTIYYDSSQEDSAKLLSLISFLELNLLNEIAKLGGVEMIFGGITLESRRLQ